MVAADLSGVWIPICTVLVVFLKLLDGFVTRIADNDSKECGSTCDGCQAGAKEHYVAWRKSWLSFVLDVFFLITAASVIGYYSSDDRAFNKEPFTGVSGTTVNVFGAAKSVGDETNVWDASDIAVPATENVMFFITTKIVRTENQTRRECPEPQSVLAAHCVNDSECLPVGHVFDLGWGLSNGTCSNITNTCFVDAWCPIEDGSAVHSGLAPNNSIVETFNGTENFVILIKNHVSWQFDPNDSPIRRSNVHDSHYPSGKMHLHSNTNKHSPFFKLKYILDEADSSTEDMFSRGGVISIRITWRCYSDDDFDCKPEYKFFRVDDGSDFKWGASGYNYSDTIHSYYSNNARHHTRSVGILFIIEVDAVGFKSSPTYTLIHLGSVMALVEMAPAATIAIFLVFGLLSAFCC